MPDAGEQNRKERLYLDDLHVGQRFTSGTHTIDAPQIKAYASQFDPQPFHLDDEAAKDTLFGGLAASGWYLCALAMRMMVTPVCMYPRATAHCAGAAPRSSGNSDACTLRHPSRGAASASEGRMRP